MHNWNRCAEYPHRMATWTDLDRIARALPDTTEATSVRDLLVWSVRGEAIAWERPLSPVELRALGDAAPKGPVLGVHIPDPRTRDALIAAVPDVYFDLPQYDGPPAYPAVLVWLDRIPVPELQELIVAAWRARAPRRLVRRWHRKSRGSAALFDILPWAGRYRA